MTYCYDDQINEDEMGEARGTCATEKMFTEFGGSPEGQGPLKNTFA